MMNLDEALRLFVRSRIAANRRASTIRQYIHAVTAYAAWTGITALDQVTVSNVRDYLAAMSTTWRPASTASARANMLAFFRWCGEEELMDPQNWTKRVPGVTLDRGMPKRFTREQISRFLVATQIVGYSSELSRRRDTAIIYLFLDTGMRSGELLRLQLADVDLDNRSCRIDSACKGRRERYVWFSPETLKRLKSYLRLRRKESPWLFTSHANRPLTGSYLLYVAKRIGREASIQDATIHRLRHTALTMLAEAGMSPILLQKFAGHAQISTTMIYARPDDRAVALEYERCAPLMRL